MIILARLRYTIYSTIQTNHHISMYDENTSVTYWDNLDRVEYRSLVYRLDAALNCFEF